MPPVQLSVKDTVCAVPGIVTDTEPEGSVEVPLHPLNAGLLVRVQIGVTALPAPSVNPDVDQVTVIVPFTVTVVGDALIVTTGVAAGAEVLMATLPVRGSTDTALSSLLVVSGKG